MSHRLPVAIAHHRHAARRRRVAPVTYEASRGADHEVGVDRARVQPRLVVLVLGREPVRTAERDMAGGVLIEECVEEDCRSARSTIRVPTVDERDLADARQRFVVVDDLRPESRRRSRRPSTWTARPCPRNATRSPRDNRCRRRGRAASSRVTPAVDPRPGSSALKTSSDGRFGRWRIGPRAVSEVTGQPVRGRRGRPMVSSVPRPLSFERVEAAGVQQLRPTP